MKNTRQHMKPELLCYKAERQWLLAVEAPWSLVRKGEVLVCQNGIPLTRDEYRENRWLLAASRAPVIVSGHVQDDSPDCELPLGDDEWLLFKLGGNEGRRVRAVSTGEYLVVVPDSWLRDETISGPPEIAPEPVSLDGYRAYFFLKERNDGQQLAFRKPTGGLVYIPTTEPAFEAVGNRLGDAAERMGALFGSAPPLVRVCSGHTWSEVGAVIVGEEGPGTGKWRKSLRSMPENAEKDLHLPTELEERRSGWYFVRLYDTSDDLIESLDFRVLCDVDEIRIDQSAGLPPASGHAAAVVHIRHRPGCVIGPVCEAARAVPVHRKDNELVLDLPPQPACDRTLWQMGPENGPRVHVTLLAERVWWAAGDERMPPSEWSDRPVMVPRSAFSAISNSALWLRFPKQRWTDRVFVGFTKSGARGYQVKATDDKVFIPLRDFGDSSELAQAETDGIALRIWIERSHDGQEAVVLRLAPAPHPVLPREYRPSAPAEKPLRHWIGRGRKKTAFATAVLSPGTGSISVNGSPVDRYFQGPQSGARRRLEQLLELAVVRELLSRLDATVTVRGSSCGGRRQATAVANGLARALWSHETTLKRRLKSAGYGGVKTHLKLSPYTSTGVKPNPTEGGK